MKRKKNPKPPQRTDGLSSLKRSFEVNRAGIDEEARTVELSFSSEEPYRRWFGDEILDHKPGSVRLDRIKTNAPLLMDQHELPA